MTSSLAISKVIPPWKHDIYVNLLTQTVQALQYASTQAALIITPITNTIDPNKQTALAASIVLFALGIGFAFTTVSRAISPNVKEILMPSPGTHSGRSSVKVVRCSQTFRSDLRHWPPTNPRCSTSNVAHR